MKNVFIILYCFLLFGCTTVKYVEKQSEELSRAVYATKDSLDYSRLDLAEKYAVESSKLVNPPKNRIQIQPIVKNTNNSTEKVLIIPHSKRKDKIIFTETEEYEQLMKDVRISEQMKKDIENWELYSKEVDRKLTEQYLVNNEMIVKIQDLEKQLLTKNNLILKKDLAILWRNIMIISLIGTMGVGVYLRIKGIL